jgi:excisionase family DNA binding protein
MTRRFISLQAGADYAACSQKTLRRHIAAGRLRGYRLGRLVRIDLDELDAIMRPIPAAGGDAA